MGFMVSKTTLISLLGAVFRATSHQQLEHLAIVHSLLKYYRWLLVALINVNSIAEWLVDCEWIDGRSSAYCPKIGSPHNHVVRHYATMDCLCYEWPDYTRNQYVYTFVINVLSKVSK